MNTLRPLLKWWLALAAAALLVRGAAALPQVGTPGRAPATRAG